MKLKLKGITERGAATAMAVSKHVLNLSEDLTCSVCQSVFVEPVRLDCEHNFCKSCIQKFWGKQRQAVSCPECQQVLPRRSFTSNKVLVNLCEKTRQLELKLEQDRSLCEEEWGNLREDTESELSLCEEHREKLILFCEVDEILICAKCVDSPVHSAHRFLPSQTAIQTYKDQLKLCLDSMETERKDQSKLKQQQEREISQLEELTGSLEKDISAEFAKIHRFLEDKEKHLIEDLRRQKEDDLRPVEENLRRIEEELASLKEKISNLCVDIEQQDNVSFLKELKRYRESYGLKTRKWDMQGEMVISRKSKIRRKKRTIMELRRGYTRFRGPLLYIVWREMKQIISPAPASLTLDPNTAHRNLILSEDRTSVRLGIGGLNVPDNLQRFDTVPCVLSSQGFTSGKHYWEVQVGDKVDWGLGVVIESANRKGSFKYGYWQIPLSNGTEIVAAKIPSVPLTRSVNRRNIGVFLDYEGGRVTFYNADDMSILHTLTDTFTEKLFPFFSPRSCDVGKNAAIKLRQF
ncbi:zinc-binding protein A33-like [Scyliorhinus torazame]|uniref:zinc-binding protein A33-like n=1 Tax=Scyliorhinus torazame TaxID=75743 RepID=UPI003B5952A3